MVAGVGLVMRATVPLTVELERVERKFKLVFQEEARRANRELSDFAERVGMTAWQTKRTANALQDMLVPLGMTRKEAADASIAMTKLSADLASFEGRSIEQVMFDMQAMLAGSTEVMKKYGVILNQNLLEQELMRMGFRGTVNDASEAAKAVAKLNLIIKGTKDAHGLASRMNKTLEGRFNQFKARLAELGAEVGRVFTPSLFAASEGANKMLKFLKENSAAIAQFGETLGRATEVVVNFGLKLSTILADSIMRAELLRIAMNIVTEGIAAGFKFMVDNMFAVLMAFFDNLPLMMETAGKLAVSLFFEHFSNMVSRIWTMMQQMFSAIVWGFMDMLRSMEFGLSSWIDKSMKRFTQMGGEVNVAFGTEAILKDFMSQLEGPEWKGMEMPPSFKNLKELLADAEGKMSALEKKSKRLFADRPPNEIGFSGDLGGGKDKKIKVELVAAKDLFSKTLKDQFDKDKDNQVTLVKTAKAHAEIAKKGLEKADKTVKVLEDTKKAVEKLGLAP